MNFHSTRFNRQVLVEVTKLENDSDVSKTNPETLFHCQDKEYLRKECENYRLSNLKLEARLQKVESKLSPNSAALINKITELEETTEVRLLALIVMRLSFLIM